MPVGETELPAVYHENVLCLMVQAPDVVFAYWDLSLGHIRSIGGEKELVLCLYKDNLLNHKVTLPPLTNNWYFRNVEPGFLYYCELGFSGAGGTFFPLLRSNRVNTPGSGPAAEEAAEGPGRAAGPDFAALLTGQAQSYQKEELLREMAFYMGFPRSGE